MIRRAALFVPPLLVIAFELAHPVLHPPMYPAVSHHLPWWLYLHLANLAIFPLLGLSAFLLVEGRDGRAASIARAAAVVYVPVYAAFGTRLAVGTAVLVWERARWTRARRAGAESLIDSYWGSGVIFSRSPLRIDRMGHRRVRRRGQRSPPERRRAAAVVAVLCCGRRRAMSWILPPAGLDPDGVVVPRRRHGPMFAASRRPARPSSSSQARSLRRRAAAAPGAPAPRRRRAPELQAERRGRAEAEARSARRRSFERVRAHGRRRGRPAWAISRACCARAGLLSRPLADRRRSASLITARSRNERVGPQSRSPGQRDLLLQVARKTASQTNVRTPRRGVSRRLGQERPRIRRSPRSRCTGTAVSARRPGIVIASRAGRRRRSPSPPDLPGRRPVSPEPPRRTRQSKRASHSAMRRSASAIAGDRRAEQTPAALSEDRDQSRRVPAWRAGGEDRDGVGHR